MATHPEQSATRAPRLTENRLDDLAIVVEAIGADIAYLKDAVPTYPKGSALYNQLNHRLEALTRGRDWIAGKISAERAQRAESGPEVDLSLARIRAAAGPL